MGGASYAYDGAGNRISQTIGVDVTQYLLDLQPGLATVLQSTQASDTTRYIHAPRGIHSQQDAASFGSLDNWTWMLQDGLGSVRSVVDGSLSVLESRLYEPYGTPFGASGTNQTVYGFTGEPTDANDLLYLRARYYAPNLGVFTGLDPFEGISSQPMTLNRYMWVGGNVINMVDPTGTISVPTGLQLANVMNSACMINAVFQEEDCALRSYVDRVAAFARQESNQEDQQLFPTAAAIALAEINSLNAGNSPRSRSSTYSESTLYINSTKSARILTLASRFVDGSCAGNLPQVVDQQATDYPELSGYIADLRYIAQNPTMAYEHSFVSDNRSIDASSSDALGVVRGERLGRATITNINREQEAFKFRVFRGSTLSVIVSNDFNPVPLEWNCSATGNRVINSTYNPNSVDLPDFVSNSTCVAACNKNLWWWQPPSATIANQYAKNIYPMFNEQYNDGDTWIKIPNSNGTDQDFQSVIVNVGGRGHVASCS